MDLGKGCSDLGDIGGNVLSPRLLFPFLFPPDSSCNDKGTVSAVLEYDDAETAGAEIDDLLASREGFGGSEAFEGAVKMDGCSAILVGNSSRQVKYGLAADSAVHRGNGSPEVISPKSKGRAVSLNFALGLFLAALMADVLRLALSRLVPFGLILGLPLVLGVIVHALPSSRACWSGNWLSL